MRIAGEAGVGNHISLTKSLARRWFAEHDHECCQGRYLHSAVGQFCNEIMSPFAARGYCEFSAQKLYIFANDRLSLCKVSAFCDLHIKRIYHSNHHSPHIFFFTARPKNHPLNQQGRLLHGNPASYDFLAVRGSRAVGRRPSTVTTAASQRGSRRALQVVIATCIPLAIAT